MEELKRSYLKKFLHRVNLRLEIYMKKIKDQEEKLRACYADVIEFSSKDFVQIMMVDAAINTNILRQMRQEHMVEEPARICCAWWLFQSEVKNAESFLPPIYRLLPDA
ncbi:unnamed protein product [Prunus armeniaca]